MKITICLDTRNKMARESIKRIMCDVADDMDIELFVVSDPVGADAVVDTRNSTITIGSSEMDLPYVNDMAAAVALGIVIGNKTK